MANYEDERFQQVENEKEQALNSINSTYNDMIAKTDQTYSDLVNATNEYSIKQQELQQQQNDLTMQQIQEQKDRAEKDYIREQKGAYADWQKQANTYGGNAEALAARGLSYTGYSETGKLDMYNTYQNRVAQARDTFTRIVADYDAQMNQARLTNSTALAQIAFNALQTQLQYTIEGFQYKNSLLQQQIALQQSTDDRYYSRWQDVLQQINTEDAIAASGGKSSGSGRSGSSGTSALITGSSAKNGIGQGDGWMAKTLRGEMIKGDGSPSYIQTEDGRGIKPTNLGRTVNYNGEEYTLYGYNLNGKTMPVIWDGSDWLDAEPLISRGENKVVTGAAKVASVVNKTKKVAEKTPNLAYKVGKKVGEWLS